MPHSRVLSAFQKPLNETISQSPLLRVTISEKSRLRDCSRLRAVSDGLPESLLQAVLEGSKETAIHLQLARLTSGSIAAHSPSVIMYRMGFVAPGASHQLT
jgi:hypothetical protein